MTVIVIIAVANLYSGSLMKGDYDNEDKNDEMVSKRLRKEEKRGLRVHAAGC